MSENPFSAFLRSLDRIGRGYAEVNRRVSSLLEWLEPAVSRLREGAVRFGEALIKWRLLCIITFYRGGWSEVPLRDMELSEFIPLVDRLRDKPNEEVKVELDSAILDYFRREDYTPLSNMVASWNPRFENRHHILEDALWAHKLGYYTLSVPTLAAQFEGIIRERTEEYGYGNQWKRTFLETLSYDYGQNNPPRSPTIAELPEIMELPAQEQHRMAEELKNDFTLHQIQALFDDQPFSEPGASSVVNRHVILHGVFGSFGEKESLRLFFVLDLLHEAIGMYDARALPAE